MERVRLVGIARGPARVLVQRTVVVDDQGAFGRIDVLEPFDLELADGRRVRVDSTKDARIEPLREEKVRWGDIEDDPSFAALREKGPAPHVAVVVKRAAIRDGDRVALDGEEKDFAFEDEASATMRTAPTKRLIAVSAEVLASGPDAETIVAHVVDGPPERPQLPPHRTQRPERRRPGPARTYVSAPKIVLASGGALVAVALGMRVSPAKVDVGGIGLALVAVAAYLSYAARLPRFMRGERTVEDNGKAIFAASVIGAMAAGGFLVSPLLGDLGGTTASNASPLVVGVLGVWLAILVVVLLRATKQTAALVTAIAKAPPFARDFADHAWGSANGVVRDPTPITYGGEQRALAQVVDVRVQSGSDPDIVVEKVINHGTFFVDTEVGSFELHPSDATWSSSVRQLVEEGADRKRWAYVVPLDGSVVVAGRATRSKNEEGDAARFAKGRGDALVFYATAAGRDAGAEIRRLAAARTTTLAIILACFAAMVGWAVALAPELPPFHVEGGE